MVGFDAVNKDAIGTVYKCRLCKLILRDPYQISCSGAHRCCKTCIDGHEGNVIMCPECEEETPKDEIMPDRGFRNDMKGLKIICPSCAWNGSFQAYESHQCELAEHVLSDTLQISTCNPVNPPRCAIPTAQQESVSAMELISEQSVPNSTGIIDGENATTQMQEIYETINILADGIQVLNDDAQRHSVDLIQLQSAIESSEQNLSLLQISIQEANAFLTGIQINQNILQQEVESLKQTIDDMQHVSYNGTSVWKITNVLKKMMDSQSERQTAIYSPPFYSSPTGYKMRARLHLFGNGDARRTHMSLFFVLMRGPNDGILTFPFNYKVTFCLYDQTPQLRHIIESFRPDIESISFQRPRSDMNIASGIPKFFPLARIQQEGNPYVRDDTMFIKVMVDFVDIPQTLLPYALSLNPGLPMHVQLTMIKQEAERRAQQQQQSPTSSTNCSAATTLPSNN